MKTERLTLYWRISGLKVAELHRHLDLVLVTNTQSDCFMAFIRYAQNGVTEWIGDGDQVTPRITYPHDPDFMERLGDHLRRIAMMEYTIEC